LKDEETKRRIENRLDHIRQTMTFEDTHKHVHLALKNNCLSDAVKKELETKYKCQVGYNENINVTSVTFKKSRTDGYIFTVFKIIYALLILSLCYQLYELSTIDTPL